MHSRALGRYEDGRRMVEATQMCSLSVLSASGGMDSGGGCLEVVSQ